MHRITPRQGNCVNLARHPHGAPVLEALYVRLPPGKRPTLLQEFYGREARLCTVRRAADWDG